MAKPRTADKNSCVITVKVVPRSSQNAIFFQGPDTYKVKLTSSPVEGAANRHLTRFLAEKLSVAPRDIEILSGAHSNLKRLKIRGLASAKQLELLAADRTEKP